MFLPVSKKELEERNIEQLDFVMVIGEAYVDHPSFGHAIISRLIESLGFTVGIISQPQKDTDYKIFGAPKYSFLISSGVIDSMVNNYSVGKIKRKIDVYSPAGKSGLRPDMATVVYTKAIKKIYPDSYCIIGSIEASLRKFAHYDYWQDKVLEPIIILSGADLLMYGMSENSIIQMCGLLKKGVPIQNIRSLRGTMYKTSDSEEIEKLLTSDNVMQTESFETVCEDKKAYAKMHMEILENQDDVYGKTIIQKVSNDFVVQNPPQKPLNEKELDKIYELPYERTYHPMYESQGGIEAIKEVEFSLTSCRGCFGACNYCALTYHQGRKVTSRSHDSILKEAEILTKKQNFKGYIHDVGGPTANFRKASCTKQEAHGVCVKKQCLSPKPCNNLEVDHSDYLTLLRKLRKIETVKKVFIRSGIRYDYLMADTNKEFLEELCKYHISGQLKVAPEHSQNGVLDKMGKPRFDIYLKFSEEFKKMNEKLKQDQYLVPYFISSHPGCTLADAIKLAEYLHSIHYIPQQVQDFYPTPGTISTCMYYTKLDPRTMEKIYVPTDFKDKKMQRALLQYRKKENYSIVLEALVKAKRFDLIGFEPTCLIKPLKEDVYKFKKAKEDLKEEKKIKDKKAFASNRLKRRSQKNKKKIK